MMSRYLCQKDTFISYQYPDSSLVLADASLVFCAENEFDRVWNAIFNSLNTGGIFCGSFVGPNDSMASPDYAEKAYWPNVLVFKKKTLRSKFNEFEILKFTEHNVSGHTPEGLAHEWHVFSVVARKI